MSETHAIDTAAPAPPAASARGISPETVTREVLDNGLIVIVYPNHAVPIVNMTLSCEAGAVFEPPELNGLASFTARMMRRGTLKKTFERLNIETEERGISVGTDAGQHTLSIGGRALAEDAGLLLDFIREIARTPAFPLEEIERLRTLTLAGLKEDEDDTRSVAERAFREHLYPADHPYHRRVSGTLETVPRLTRKDMVAFYRAQVRPDVGVLVIVGDIETGPALDLAQRAFGDWTADGPRPTYTVPDVPPLSGAQQTIKALAGKTQNDLVLGVPGIRRDNPDYYALLMMNLLLGRIGLYGRLGKNVREEKGLAYYVYSSFDAGRGPGAWAVRAGVNPSNVGRAVEGILTEIARMREEGATEEELTNGVAFLTGILPLQLETNGGIAGTLLDIEFYKLGFDYIQRYPGIIRGITAADVHRAATRYLPTDTYVLTVAGPAVTLDGAGGNGTAPPPPAATPEPAATETATEVTDPTGV
jgi:zinc protease